MPMLTIVEAKIIKKIISQLLRVFEKIKRDKKSKDCVLEVKLTELRPAERHILNILIKSFPDIYADMLVQFPGRIDNYVAFLNEISMALNLMFDFKQIPSSEKSKRGDA